MAENNSNTNDNAVKLNNSNGNEIPPLKQVIEIGVKLAK